MGVPPTVITREKIPKLITRGGGSSVVSKKAIYLGGGNQQTHASQAGKGNGGVWADSIPGRNAGDDGTSMGQTGGLTIKRAVFCSFFTSKTKKIPVV